MQEYILRNKLNLFIKNYGKIKEIKGSWQMGMMQYSCVLSSTIKNQNINPIKVEESIDIIKKNTGMFSNFRGHSLFYLSNLLSTKSDIENSFKSILSIYEKLKSTGFYNDAYLPFAAIIICENKDKMDADTSIEKTKYVYDFMKKNHRWLTSSDDYCRASLIAIHSKDLGNDLEYIEESYNELSLKGFYKSNNLQSLSHIMALDNNKSENSLDKVVRIRQLLEQNNCKIDGYGYPLIGALSLLEYDEEQLVQQIKSVSDELRQVKGFGNWAIGKSNRNMISAAIVASSYADCLNQGSNVDEISSNIFVEIIIAIEIATMVAIIAATSASAAAN